MSKLRINSSTFLVRQWIVHRTTGTKSLMSNYVLVVEQNYVKQNYNKHNYVEHHFVEKFFRQNVMLKHEEKIFRFRQNFPLRFCL